MTRKRKAKEEETPLRKQPYWFCPECDWKGNRPNTSRIVMENQRGHPTWSICPECGCPVLWFME